MDLIRQGDVALFETDLEPPEGLEPKTIIILAEGELTGHAHRLTGHILDWEVEGQRYVRAIGDSHLYHEDHDPNPVSVLIPGKTYKVIPQQEWDLENQWRKVVD